MNHNQRAQVASETLKILEQGFYFTPSGRKVEIGSDLEWAVKNTELFTPDALKAAPYDARSFQTRIEVTNESTLQAAYRLVRQDDGPVLCLNFASAKNPGGGFLGGAQAQEESLARSSGLYLTLTSKPEFYSYHRRSGDLLYSDHMICSPAVPVFRDDEGNLLESPYLLSFITSPAPNAGAIAKNQPEKLARIGEVLRSRSAKILAIASKYGYRRLILGAWGCGVFRNSTAEVARVFHQHLAPGGAFHGHFEEITFAVLDKSAGQPTYNAFRQQFSEETI